MFNALTITRPVEELLQGAIDLLGNFQARIDMPVGGELIGFNAMASQLGPTTRPIRS